MTLEGVKGDGVKGDGGDGARAKQRKPRNVRLPGFISDQEVGLGDAIKHATRRAGIQPCGGCEKRAAALNRWVVFSGRSSS